MFPTCVGMNRRALKDRAEVCGVPHRRGDEPTLIAAGENTLQCSPHAWGRPAYHGGRLSAQTMFPTHVGMNRSRASGAVRPSRVSPWSGFLDGRVAPDEHQAAIHPLSELKFSPPGSAAWELHGSCVIRLRLRCPAARDFTMPKTRNRYCGKLIEIKRLVCRGATISPVAPVRPSSVVTFAMEFCYGHRYADSLCRVFRHGILGE